MPLIAGILVLAGNHGTATEFAAAGKAPQPGK
jgi:hypothetical protein